MANGSTTKRSISVIDSVRIVLAAAAQEPVRFHVPEIARRTGMTHEEVREILASPTYLMLIQQEASQVIMHALTNGAQRMDEIIQNANSSDLSKIAAYRAIVATYQAISQRGQPQKPPGEDDDAMTRWEKNLSKMKELKPDASDRRTRAGAEAEPEEGE